MDYKTIYDKMKPQQRRELLTYIEKEREYLPKWALRFHAPNKVSETPEEILDLIKVHPHTKEILNVCPDEEQEEAHRQYINSLPWFRVTPTASKDEIVDSLMEVGEPLMEGEYLFSLTEKQTAPKGHSFAIDPRAFWEGVERKRRADIALYVGSKRDRLRAAFLPIVKESLLLFFNEYKDVDPFMGVNDIRDLARERGLKKIDQPLSKKGEEALSSVTKDVLDVVESLSLNLEKIMHWDEIDRKERMAMDGLAVETMFQLLPLIHHFNKCERAAICRSGKDFLQMIDRGRILEDVRLFLSEQHKFLNGFSCMFTDEAIAAAQEGRSFDELPSELKAKYEEVARNLNKD